MKLEEEVESKPLQPSRIKNTRQNTEEMEAIQQGGDFTITNEHKSVNLENVEVSV